jgi:23S rRNA (uridine2552-2'-O)-methyltransferase
MNAFSMRMVVHRTIIYARKASSTKSGSSKQWLNRHVNDQYVKAAASQDLRARSAFKLVEVQEKYKIIKPKNTVVDLGAAPGSWCDYVSKLQMADSKLVAVDLLKMEDVPNCKFIQGDFTSPRVQEAVLRYCDGKIDVLLSDMLGNTSGHGDHFRSIALAMEVLHFADKALSPGGRILMKYLRGEDEVELLKAARSRFSSVKVVKPDASRKKSSEIYMLCTSFKKQTAIKKAKEA